MAPSPSTSPDQYRIVRKRNRIPLSCAPCRHRKLKCNRQHPCENCVKRNDVESCIYATPPTRNRRGTVSSEKSSDDMQSRIDRLEGLVLSLMNASNSSLDQKGENEEDSMDDSDDESSHDEDMIKEEPEDEVEDVRSAFGFMKMDKGKTMYRGDSAWNVLISEFAEVKNFFASHKQIFDELLAKQQKNENAQFGKTLFPFAATEVITKDEIIKLLPSRPVVDNLVEHWFNSFDQSYHVIHGPTFKKEYERFWANPSNSDIFWIGILFGILSVAVQGLHKAGNLEVYSELGIESIDKFKYGAEQCLIAGQFTTKLTLYNMQCLVVYTLGIRKDVADQTWLFLGLVIRIAMAMGLHRDSRKFSVEIPPYQVELRRRLWNVLCCMDLLFSIKLGLPCIIRASECDTPMPSSIHDYEFDEHSTEIPPSRDINEQTPMSYMLAKTHIAAVFAKIVLATSIISSAPSYESVFSMEKDLREAYTRVPDFLKFRSVKDTAGDHAWLITQRYSLDILYQKSLLILHRPYVTYRARNNPKYDRSRRTCIDAAMQLLSHQAALFDAQKEDLKEAKWAIESLSGQDYNSAVMLLSIELKHTYTPGSEAYDSFSLNLVERKNVYLALEKAHEIYGTYKDNYDMQKIFHLLTFALDKIGALISKASQPNESHPDVVDIQPDQMAETPSTTELTHVTSEDSSQTSSHVVSGDALKPERSAAMTLGMMSSGFSPSPNYASKNENHDPGINQTNLSVPNDPNASVLTPGGSLPYSYFSNLGGPTIDSVVNNEWDEWDNFLRGMNLDPSMQNWGYSQHDTSMFQPDGTGGTGPGGGGAGGIASGVQLGSDPNAPFVINPDEPSARL